jgi:hypothetical protein
MQRTPSKAGTAFSKYCGIAYDSNPSAILLQSRQIATAIFMPAAARVVQADAAPDSLPSRAFIGFRRYFIMRPKAKKTNKHRKKCLSSAILPCFPNTKPL